MSDAREEPTQATTTLPLAAPGVLPDAPPAQFGDYELLGELGRGGMGVVFRARERQLNRLVALKMILPGTLADASELQRFRVEAEAAARLSHPNIVAVHRVGETEGLHFYSMEYVEGPSLAQRLSNGPLPGRVAARYLSAIARAIDHAHENGILHRDLKPGNILIDGDDQPRVTDFGLAKQFTADRGQTRTGAVLGTPSYMAPEQALGRKDLGPPCDIYGLGALLYELLTGRPPFRAETALDTLYQVIDREPAPPRLLNPKIDRDLETICLKCLSKNPRDRYASAHDLAIDLERYLHGESIHARSFNVVDRLARALQRSQFDVEFRQYGNMLLWFAGIVFVTHVAKHFILTGPESLNTTLVLLSVAQSGQFILMLVVFWWYRRRQLLPQTVAERQLWSVWLGYIVACILMGIILKKQFGFERLRDMVEYPHFTIMAGMAFFVLGSSYWGGCYAIGLAYFILAGLMLLEPRWSVLEYGSLWGLVLALIGWHLRRLGREGEQHAEIGQRPSAPRPS
jgi:serine/threonine protein kinase